MSISLFERKAALINHEFNLMGVGRYQKAVWLLCGFGYLLDLMWAQAFGLSEPTRALSPAGLRELNLSILSQLPVRSIKR